ncbi:unnamed protein product [Symbiodinium natans]|uniref:Uncharacterized protein n=1 Tax=Symbiodinium natans TaxID=878477 RepID=A0A812M6Y9_9DINO|nr:unnamed protein product [Symbiodinium natans]
MARSRSRDRARDGRRRKSSPLQKGKRKRERENKEAKAKRFEQEVQRRLQERIHGRDFEALIQEKIRGELDRHFSLVKIEIDMQKKKLIEEFRHERDQEERSKQELEAIIRTNQQRTQEQQQRVAAAMGSQADALIHERGLIQKTKEQRRKVQKEFESGGGLA